MGFFSKLFGSLAERKVKIGLVFSTRRDECAYKEQATKRAKEVSRPLRCNGSGKTILEEGGGGVRPREFLCYKTEGEREGERGGLAFSSSSI